MDQSGFGQLPAELVEYWAQHLELADLLSFRLTCSRANAETFRIMAQQCFSSLTTSLMGVDLVKLRAIADDKDLRQYVKTIYIEDGFERSPQFPLARTSNIWPRYPPSMIDSDELGVATLRDMFRQKSLQPDKIVIRDYRNNDNRAGVGPAATFAKDITDGAGLAITAIKLLQTTSIVAEAIVELSREYQGHSGDLSMLRTAHITHGLHIDTYWTRKALYHSPALEDLSLFVHLPGRYHIITSKGIEGFSMTEPANLSLRHLTLSGECFNGVHLMWLLGNSWKSLTHLDLFGCRMRRPHTWREILDHIGTRCSNLKSFDLKFLVENSDAGTGKVDWIRLTPQDFEEQYRAGLNMRLRGLSGQQRLTRVAYQGAGAGDVLKTFAANIQHIH